MPNDKSLKGLAWEFFSNIKLPCDNNLIGDDGDDICIMECPLDTVLQIDGEKISVKVNVCSFLKELIKPKTCFMCGGSGSTACEFCGNTRDLSAEKFFMLVHLVKKGEIKTKFNL